MLMSFKLLTQWETGAYLGKIEPMASAEIAPLSKQKTPTFLYYYYLRQEDYDYATDYDSRKILVKK